MQWANCLPATNLPRVTNPTIPSTDPIAKQRPLYLWQRTTPSPLFHHRQHANGLLCRYHTPRSFLMSSFVPSTPERALFNTFLVIRGFLLLVLPTKHYSPSCLGHLRAASVKDVEAGTHNVKSGPGIRTRLFPPNGIQC
ncbi:hypothetical protein AB1N83_003951 [Pleurotus pulmonarius]